MMAPIGHPVEDLSSSTSGEPHEKTCSDSRNSGGACFAWPILNCLGRAARTGKRPLSAFSGARSRLYRCAYRRAESWIETDASAGEELVCARNRASRRRQRSSCPRDRMARESERASREARLDRGFPARRETPFGPGAELEKIADAAKPLYDSLDEAQKHRFGVLLHEVFQHPDHRTHWGRHPDERSDYESDRDHEE